MASRSLSSSRPKHPEELSSGYQITDAADSPALTPELVKLGSQLATVQAYQTNLTGVQSEARRRIRDRLSHIPDATC